jgi:hypothetical protein
MIILRTGGLKVLWSIFSSREKKKIKMWKKEHNQIVHVATEVISEYSKNNYPKAKEALKKLNVLAVDHLMDEDLEFYHWKKSSTPEMIQNIEIFTKSFKDVKLTLMHFLAKYSKPEKALDEIFFKEFNDLVEIITKRIEYEENMLYTKMLKN